MPKVDHKPTQNERIINYIEKHGSITQLDAYLDLGVMRLASRISDLRRLGVPIAGDITAVKNRHGETVHVKRYYIALKESEAQ